MSRLAGLALLGVAVTGIYNAVTQIGELSALRETAYGRLLLLKVAGVLGMVGLGAFNRYRGLPALRDWARGSPESRSGPPGGERFLRIAALESLLAIWVLGCTGLLSSVMPPREAPWDDKHHAATVDAALRFGEVQSPAGSPQATHRKCRLRSPQAAAVSECGPTRRGQITAGRRTNYYPSSIMAGVYGVSHARRTTTGGSTSPHPRAPPAATTCQFRASRRTPQSLKLPAQSIAHCELALKFLSFTRDGWRGLRRR